MRWDGPILTDSRRLPGHVAQQDPQARRGGRALPVAHRRLAPHAHARARRSRSSACSAPTSRCSSTSASRCRPSGAARSEAMELSLRWAERCARRVRAPGQARPGAVRIVQGGTTPSCGGARPKRSSAWTFDGLRHRRPRGRRGHRADAGDARRRRADAAGRQAALPDGRRHAGGPHRGGRARHRHVRLRAADAQRAPRPRLHVERARQPAATPATPTIRRPLDPEATARPRATIRAPTCTTSSSRASISARCCCRGRTRPSISSSWRRCARRSRRTASRPGPRRRSAASPRPTRGTPRSGRRARLRCACAARGATGTRPTR